MTKNKVILMDYNLLNVTVKNVPYIEYDNSWGKYCVMVGSAWDNVLKLLEDNENSGDNLEVLEYREV